MLTTPKHFSTSPHPQAVHASQNDAIPVNGSEAISALKTLYMRAADSVSGTPVLGDLHSHALLHSLSYDEREIPSRLLRVAMILEPYRAKTIDMCVRSWIVQSHQLDVRTDHASIMSGTDHDLDKSAEISANILFMHGLSMKVKESTEENTNHFQSRGPSSVRRSVLHIIELGVGFDTRYERLCDDSNAVHSVTLNSDEYDFIYYYEIDVREVIDIRKTLFVKNSISDEIDSKKKTHRKMYSASVYDDTWSENVVKDIIANNRKHKYHIKDFSNVCIVCEALFVHILNDEVWYWVVVWRSFAVLDWCMHVVL